jgi:hypothetical protein
MRYRIPCGGKKGLLLASDYPRCPPKYPRQSHEETMWRSEFAGVSLTHMLGAAPPYGKDESWPWLCVRWLMLRHTNHGYQQSPSVLVESCLGQWSASPNKFSPDLMQPSASLELRTKSKFRMPGFRLIIIASQPVLAVFFQTFENGNTSKSGQLQLSGHDTYAFSHFIFA